MSDTEIVTVDLTPEAAVIADGNIMISVPCGDRTFHVNCFAKPHGAIWAGSILFVTAIDVDARIEEGEEYEVFHQEFASLWDLLVALRSRIGQAKT